MVLVPGADVGSCGRGQDSWSASSGCPKGHGTFPKPLLFSQTYFLTAESKSWALGDGRGSGEDSLGKGRDRGGSEEGERMRKGKVEESEEGWLRRPAVFLGEKAPEQRDS